VHIPVLVALLLVAAGCGGYAHHKTTDNVIATAWSREGQAVHLVQQVEFEWGFVGLAPHIVDPHHNLGPLFVVSDKTRIRIPGYDDWWRIEWAFSRAQGRGFVVALSKTVSDFKEARACLLVDLKGQVVKCPAAADESVGSRPDETNYAPARDSLVFLPDSHERARGTIRAVDLTSGTVTAIDEPLWRVRLIGGELPCEMSHSALSPLNDKWVVACSLRRSFVDIGDGSEGDGLWMVGGDLRLSRLIPFAGRLHSPRGFFHAMEDSVRPFWQEFGLSWSPDGQHVYYCDGKDGPAVVVDIERRASREVAPCLTGATWSPDGKRVVGVTGDRTVGTVILE
jgi:hypothetical protein